MMRSMQSRNYPGAVVQKLPAVSLGQLSMSTVMNCVLSLMVSRLGSASSCLKKTCT